MVLCRNWLDGGKGGLRRCDDGAGATFAEEGPLGGRAAFEREAAMAGLPAYFPSRPLSTDNAAMIAAAAYPKFLAGDFAGLELSAEASLPLK